MNRKAIIIWGIVGLVAIIGIILTYILLRNNGSSSTNNANQQTAQNPINRNSENANGSANSGENQVLPEPAQSNYLPEDYSQYEVAGLPSIELKAKLKLDNKNSVTDYIYSRVNAIALTYEKESIIDKKVVYVRVLDTKIYLSLSEDDIKSGQSIEIINIDSDKRFNTIPDIVTSQLLTPVQNRDCKIIEKDAKYSVIAKDTKVKDSTAICGKYAKGNNRFFIKPQEEGTATNKLVFVTAGDRELSYDGSNNGKFWYQSVVVE
jgi:hypothetical protein